ncbi:hypothetical protein [Sandaracinus amylolyticus]|uniref:hypothetical protein n=1 Tax=Sandaracinus amylolyticus TaxID=927083 RepID=UPI001F3B973C|nr:hypothetical protein [Sandaracinus amylolyticus]UJR86364.1 Hypothetical protein I5071_84580 [Sandaracinus amylolyticus]
MRVQRPAIALLVVIASVMIAPSRAAAGPWTPEPGHGYLKLWLKWTCNCGFGYVAGDGSTYDYGFYTEVFTNAYGEIGIVPGLAAWVHWPIVETFLLEDTRRGHVGDHTVIGDPTIGLRWRWLRVGRFASALEAGVRLPFAPSGEVQPVYGRDPPHDQIGALRVGTGVFDFPLALSIGYGWDRFYLAGSGGYVARTGDFDHVVTWSAEGGGSFDFGLSLRVRFVGWHSIGNGAESSHHESPSGIGSGTNYTGFAIEADYPFERDWWIGATIEGGMFALSRQTQGPVVTLYVATRFSVVEEPSPTE